MATAEVVAPEDPVPPMVAEDASESDEETPWDQRRSPESASFDSAGLRTASQDKATAEDPPATVDGEEEAEVSPPAPADVAAAMTPDRPETPTRAGWLLRSGLPQRRPLQPPSLRGMNQSTTLESEIQRHLNFWSQLDDDGPDDEIEANKSRDDEEKKKKRAKIELSIKLD